ncbi:exodeoxyribonuclease III [Streptomyces sp. CBG31]|uniref:exodeoxyribonuclease III n=1 Tax=Streptomyces sp. CBG31 TaxID=2762623 RepID=UPI0028F74384|nr:exodeoxyribonuclease III [Streptomyces sp. CBG31]
MNVNGLRAAAKKGFVEWLAGTDADVVCLQEVRAEPGQLAAEVRDPEGWHTVHAPAAAKGRAGVSLYSRQAPERTQIGFGGFGVPGAEEFDASGRYVEIDLPGVTVASLYLPSGEVGTERQDEKERFMAAFLPYLQGLKERAAADGREVLVCGDWNIAHQEADLKNWKANQKSSGFLPEERAWLTRSSRRPRTSTSYGGCTPMWRGRTAGGPTGGAPSTTTPGGASTTRSRRRGWPGARSRRGSSGPPRTASGGATTRR